MSRYHGDTRGSSRYQPYLQYSRPRHPSGTSSSVLYPRSLPEPQKSLDKPKTPYWHTIHGLIVNVSGAGLPHGVTTILDDVKASSLRHPRLLHDGNIFLAFYPKDTLDMGALFKPIDLTGEQLASLIQQDTNGLWSLDFVTQVKWHRLETTLKDVADVLLRSYRVVDNFDMPTLINTKLPHTYGYKDAGGFDTVFMQCRNAIHGFKILSAYVSFAFAIWLTSSPENAFRDAAHQLSRSGLQLSSVTLIQIQTSIVTKFSFGLRVGGIVDPHTTHWGRVFHRFARANVPIWLLWGGDDDRMCVDPIMRFVYYPPAYALNIAKSRYIVDTTSSAALSTAFDYASECSPKQITSASSTSVHSVSNADYGDTVWETAPSESETDSLYDEYDYARDTAETEDQMEAYDPSSSQSPTPSSQGFVDMAIPSIEAYIRIRHGYFIDCTTTSPSHVDLYGTDALAEDSDKPFLCLLFKDMTNLPPATVAGVTSWWNVMKNISNIRMTLPPQWDLNIDSYILSRQQIFTLAVAETPLGVYCYILSLVDSSPHDWSIATTSASALLSIYRQSDITTVHAAAKAMLKLGIPFRTVISRPTRSRLHKQSSPTANPLLEVMTAIGSTPHEFYPHYEQLRDGILQTRVGRNALLRGGIMWRLSQHIVPIETVLAGPTYANELVASDKFNSYFDDTLSQAAAEIIVGAFHFEGANRGLRSYWPRYETFAGSGLDGGQWLPDAERWYGNHLEGLQSGGQPLKSSRSWTADLKRNVKACRPIIQASEDLSARFIVTKMRLTRDSADTRR